jgi:hypothetical protein
MRNDEEGSLVISFILGALLSCICTTIAYVSVDTVFLYKFKKEAIECGAAQYNPVDGKFEWKKRAENNEQTP